MFSGSNVPVRGRYYFADPDTPFYEGWHNLGSADWTFDREEPYEAPQLGEDRELRFGYSKGALGVPSPAPGVLGTSPCISDGEQVFPPPDRPMVAGIDVRCWENAGLPVPDPIPYVWYTGQAARLDPVSGNINRAIDLSLSGFDASQDIPFSQPFQTVDGLGNRGFGLSKSLHFPVTSTLMNNVGTPLGVRHSVYAVGAIPADGVHNVGGGFTLGNSLNRHLLRVTIGGVNYITSTGGGFGISHTWTRNATHLWYLRRLPDHGKMGYDGSPEVTGGIVPTATSDFSGFFIQDSNNFVPTLSVLFEVQVFLSYIEDAQHAAIISGLKTKYGIP